jgi:ribonuclease-3
MKNYNPNAEDFARLLGEVENAAGYTFQDRKLLMEAVRHSSYVAENPACGICNERLEFLGDAVLELAVSQRLFNSESQAQEGTLTVSRALLVDEEANSHYAVQLGLDRVLLLGKGENRTGGRTRKSILGDLFEAFLGAVYSDGGLAAAEAVVAKVIPDIGAWRERARLANAKGDLQEFCQGKLHCRPAYVNETREGACHDPVFTIQVEVNGEIVGSGSGKSKNEAQQKAAAAALELLKKQEDDSKL